MLKIILDTNLFRTELKGLETYSFSSLFEKLISYIKNSKINDVQLCMTETSLKEFTKQMADDYQKFVVDAYSKAYSIIRDSLPIIRLSFRSKDDFMDEFYNGMMERLNNDGIEIIETLPINQIGGMKMTDVLVKTIRDIAPFDKVHNHNLKDAFISETINSKAKDNNLNDYLFITCNKKDFIQNTAISRNYKVGYIEENDSKDKLLLIMKILKNFGVHIDEETFYRDFLYSHKVREDIKRFLEISIIENQFYDNVPEIKKHDDGHYELNYEVDYENNIEIKFIIVDGENEHGAGIIYNLNKDEFPMTTKYIYYSDDNGEEVYYNEF